MNTNLTQKKNNFIVGECTKCKKTVWPVMDYCNHCFGKVVLKEGPCEGNIIEFSRQDNEYFCLIELNHEIRIMGRIRSGTPKQGRKVRIKNFEIKNNNYSFEFSFISQNE